MTIHTGIDPRVLQQLGDDVDQLVAPIPRPPHHTRSWRGATRGRRRAYHLDPLPPLLDALRDAAAHQNQGGNAPRSRPVPGSRPPLNLDATAAITDLYVALSGWRWEIIPTHHVAADADWMKVTLRALVGAAPNLAGGVAARLAGDVHDWWRTAAHHAGLTPEELRRLRNGTRG